VTAETLGIVATESLVGLTEDMFEVEKHMNADLGGTGHFAGYIKISELFGIADY
jgi:hypothetical protein